MLPETTPENILSNLGHILNILQERLYLYKKRSLETKRAMKAYHRAKITPEPFRVQIMIEAELLHSIYHIAFKSISSLIQNDSSSLLKQVSKCNDFSDFLEQAFRNQVLKMTSLFSNFEHMDFFQLSKVPYTLHDDYQRKLVAKIIFNHTREIVEYIFKDVVILDRDYANQVIRNLQQFLLEKYSFSEIH